VAAGVDGAEHLLPATFLVIVATVTFYGFVAAPAARVLGLTTDDVDPEPTRADVD
jgi:NhaP-type Na+/H+ or K+/H+ antiporter